MTYQPDGSSLHLTWDGSADDLAAAGVFASNTIGSDTAYISHGEIQTGLSIDASHWAPNLAELYRADFNDLGDSRELLVARDDAGAIVGIAVLAWEETARRRFAVLEDMAVDPAKRSLGIGAALLAEVQARVRAKGGGWLFLESGVRNARAHAFFERAGFAMISHVFGMDVQG